MKDFLTKLFERKIVQPTGALLDSRSKEEKVDDIQFKDIVATANAVNWVKKDSYRTFPKLNQNKSYMCGANALAKALGIAYSTKYGTYIPFSRPDIYQRRTNKPSAGMALYDMFRIASEGVTLEQLTPKEINTDYDADTLLIENFKHDIGKVFSITGGVYLPADIDVIASVIQTTGKGIILLTYFLSEEWSKEYPVMLNKLLSINDSASLRHFVVATDFGMESVGKILAVDDSAWFGDISNRKVSETWIKNRVYGAGYPTSFKFQVSKGDKPTYDGITIISAQKCLRYEGLFPINVDYFEAVGPTTRIAIEAFQKKYGLVVTKALDVDTTNTLHKLYP